MAELGLPNPRWEESADGETTLTFPLIAKIPAGGYDGRGVFFINSQEELSQLAKASGSPLLLEEKLQLDQEVSVLVARSPHGQAATGPQFLQSNAMVFAFKLLPPFPIFLMR